MLIHQHLTYALLRCDTPMTLPMLEHLDIHGLLIQFLTESDIEAFRYLQHKKKNSKKKDKISLQ